MSVCLSVCLSGCSAVAVSVLLSVSFWLVMSGCVLCAVWSVYYRVTYVRVSTRPQYGAARRHSNRVSLPAATSEGRVRVSHRS